MKSVFNCVVAVFLFSSLHANAELLVSDATVRLLPPGVPNTSVYFSVKNTGDVDRFLVGVETKMAETAELHAHIMEDGVMKMRQQQQVPIGAGETVHFAPGGLHVMMFGLTQPLQQNQHVMFSLLTQDKQRIEVHATVVMPGDEKSSHHHH